MHGTEMVLRSAGKSLNSYCEMKAGKRWNTGGSHARVAEPPQMLDMGGLPRLWLRLDRLVHLH
jgi:hypothetical protein